MSSLRALEAAVKDFERELDSARTRTELNSAAKRLMRAKAQLVVSQEQPR